MSQLLATVDLLLNIGLDRPTLCNAEVKVKITVAVKGRIQLSLGCGSLEISRTIAYKSKHLDQHDGS